MSFDPKSITPANVHETIGKHMLADGFDIVFDLDKSHGSWIYDSRANKEYLDFFTFFASSPVGFNHPKMRNDEYMKELGRVALNNITNSDLYTVEMARFVETFFNIAAPANFKYSFWVSGGTLGVENAIKAAMDWKVRKNFQKGYRKELGTKVIHFENAFHGRGGYTVSLTNTADPRKYLYFAKFDWPRVIHPSLRYPVTPQEIERVEKLEKLAVAQIQQAFRSNPDEICAIIIEPIQGEGGDNHIRNEFARELRRLADENEALLIFDEVQTGVGLTGKWWGFQHFDIEPDIFSMAKKMQVGGFLSNSRIDEIENNVFHESSRINSTWGANLVDMYRISTYLEIIRDEKLIDNTNVVGAKFLTGLDKLQEEFKFLSNARGKGLFLAFDLPDGTTRGDFLKLLWDNGMAVLGCGTHSIRFRPALNLTLAEADEGLKRLRIAAELFAAKK
ncbi:MAG: L-lysine 6-transaminase [bacterium]|nr:L-lysine 6-transaminase [bacterium]